MDGSVSPYLRDHPPLRSEAEVAAIRDRADLYERVLNFDEARAWFVAAMTHDQRVGHWFEQLRQGPPDGAPMFDDERAKIARLALHPNVGAAFWHSEHGRLADLSIILDELIDEAPRGYWLDLRGARVDLQRRIACVRAFALEMEREADRRSAGRAA